MTLSLTIADLRSYLDQLPEQATQRITITTSGAWSYVLGYESSPTAAIASSAPASAVQAALLPVVAAATGDRDPIRVYGAAGGPYLVTFRQAVALPSPITVVSSTLTGPSAPGVQVEPSLDAVLADILARATAVVEGALAPVVFGPYSAPGPQLVRTEPAESLYLKPPAHQHGSVSAVRLVASVTDALDSGELLNGWITEGAYLVRDTPWPARSWIAVTAAWGYGPADPAAQQLALELATNMWRQRDRGLFSESQGVDGAGQVTYVGGLTRQQQAIVHNIRRRFREIVT